MLRKWGRQHELASSSLSASSSFVQENELRSALKLVWRLGNESSSNELRFRIHRARFREGMFWWKFRGLRERKSAWTNDDEKESTQNIHLIKISTRKSFYQILCRWRNEPKIFRRRETRRTYRQKVISALVYNIKASFNNKRCLANNILRISISKLSPPRPRRLPASLGKSKPLRSRYLLHDDFELLSLINL